MNKVILLGLALLMVACPVACVNDPTADDATCFETSTGTCVLDEVTDEASVDQTGTETATE